MLTVRCPKHTAPKRVILGYSNGGSELTYVCQMGFPVDLALALDPTIWLSMVPLGKNVRRAICFHDTNPLNPVGHAYLKKGPDFNGTLITIDTSDLHLNVDTGTIGSCYHHSFLPLLTLKHRPQNSKTLLPGD